ncbi:DUF6480 family protein [Mycolicibacterium sp. 120270]|uniref:DUF6480 family protein n=1 Tax=Mycolicibacterium sp. 120270 TaxID=3090600 RepID=UPI00299E101D|nr:DUF6480 family protein [Mycolicibacterium sp. 120270]MDX1883960.1 DUF6480 family protein [Mycolicibacterium sp. 120270]
MTATPPDPDPARTPSLEPGGGVRPGETPPDSAQTSGLSEPQPRARRKYTPATVTGIVVIALFVLLFVAVGVLLVVDMLV